LKYESGQETTPMGPGWFILFNDPLNTVIKAGGSGSAKTVDEFMEIMPVLFTFIEKGTIINE